MHKDCTINGWGLTFWDVDGKDVLGEQLVDLKHVRFCHSEKLLEGCVTVNVPLVLRVLQIVALDVLPQLLHNLFSQGYKLG